MGFGAWHRLNPDSDGELDWNLTDEHFISVIERIMGAVTLSVDRATMFRRAGVEAINFALAVSNEPGTRCPICAVRPQR